MSRDHGRTFLYSYLSGADFRFLLGRRILVLLHTPYLLSSMSGAPTHGQQGEWKIGTLIIVASGEETESKVVVAIQVLKRFRIQTECTATIHYTSSTFLPDFCTDGHPIIVRTTQTKMTYFTARFSGEIARSALCTTSDLR